MKKLSNTEAELIKSVAYKKFVHFIIDLLQWQSVYHFLLSVSINFLSWNCLVLLPISRKFLFQLTIIFFPRIE